MLQVRRILVKPNSGTLMEKLGQLLAPVAAQYKAQRAIQAVCGIGLLPDMQAFVNKAMVCPLFLHFDGGIVCIRQ